MEALHSPVLRVLAHPVVAPGLFIASLMVFYYSPVRAGPEDPYRSQHHDGAFLLVGYVFAWVVCGIDPGPTRPPYPLRLVLMIATLAFHALFGVVLIQGSELLAGD